MSAIQPQFSGAPLYELRLEVAASGVWQLSVYQLPSPVTPRLTAPEHVGTLKGETLRFLEGRILKRLKQAKIQLGRMRAGATNSWPLDEESAVMLGLLFRTLAPMRNLERVQQVAEGIEAMSREESGYWLGMALHRNLPRRVLASLRMLLTTK